MKFWQFLAFAEPDQLTGIARLAEEVGFHGVLVGDHAFFPERLASTYPYVPDGKPAFGAGTPWPDPWVAISAMAAVTTRLHFATSVYILPLRDPLLVASSVATAAVLSGNRVALGAGAGWMREEYDQMGIDFASRGRRYDEAIDVLRKLWQGGMVEHHGEFFDFDRLEVEPAPSEPVPVYIGGESGPAMRRAARLGDGWIGTGTAPDDLARQLARLRSLRRQAGRDHLPFETMASVAALPDPGVYGKLEEQGLSGVVHWPFKYWLGESSTLDEKRAGMEQYAERVIVPLNG